MVLLTHICSYFETNSFSLSLKGPEQSTYLNVAFRTIYNEKLNAVNALDPAIRSQWTSFLSMAYHWWKHENDFEDSPGEIHGYFYKHANNLFKTENLTVQLFTQGDGYRIGSTGILLP
ncbi:unnamed protein product [Adineta steineri]|uniref:Uncharacterized protein n=1 Tax=Adineta steineri TaxID=433720 RepID=A0A814ZI48_9BILA|nr:unnamed protein product [Adineta steineri]CAF1382894.1 unnamed protein product [Adineta steineri]